MVQLRSQKVPKAKVPNQNVKQKGRHIFELQPGGFYGAHPKYLGSPKIFRFTLILTSADLGMTQCALFYHLHQVNPLQQKDLESI